MIDPDRIVITRHAWIRFKERWPGEQPECITTELKRLIGIAEPEDLGYGATVRIISNGFRAAEYYSAEGWRFVFDEEKTRVLTCERIYYKKRPNTVTRRKKRRNAHDDRSYSQR